MVSGSCHARRNRCLTEGAEFPQRDPSVTHDESFVGARGLLVEPLGVRWVHDHIFASVQADPRKSDLSQTLLNLVCGLQTLGCPPENSQLGVPKVLQCTWVVSFKTLPNLYPQIDVVGRTSPCFGSNVIPEWIVFHVFDLQRLCGTCV